MLGVFNLDVVPHLSVERPTDGWGGLSGRRQGALGGRGSATDAAPSSVRCNLQKLFSSAPLSKHSNWYEFVRSDGSQAIDLQLKPAAIDCGLAVAPPRLVGLGRLF